MDKSETTPVERLVEIMRRLRSPDGCPWDREQTLESLKTNLVEEAYEVIDAIDDGDRAALREELGDLLLQVVFQAQICAEEGAFTFDDVVQTIVEKLIRRHPHVFGAASAKDSGEVLKQWEEIKRAEKGDGDHSVVGNIPRHLPALHKAHHVQRRVARVGFDWQDVVDVVAKIEEEIGEVKEAVAGSDRDRMRDEIGDLLFSVVNLSRFLGFDAEDALNHTVRRFVHRFRELEHKARSEGRELGDYDLKGLDALWREVKAEERQDG